MAALTYRSPPEPKPPNPLVAGRENMVLTVVLTMITVGIYEIVWYWRRREAFRALGVRSTVSEPVLYATIGLFVASIALHAGHPDAAFVCGMGDTILRFVLAFQARAVINEWAVRETMPAARSGVWTFVWRFWYLQTRINRIAEREKEISKLRPRRT